MTPEQTGSASDGLVAMANVFVDPATTAKRVQSQYSWVWPLLVLCAGYAVFAYLMKPYSTQLMDLKMAEQNIPPERMERAQAVAHMISNVTMVIAPIMVIAFIALFALLIKVTYSIMDVRPRYRDVFSLLACCSLIPLLQYIASYIVIRSKGDAITTAEQITPPFGLDIFFQGAKGMAYAFLNYFSIFQIWYIIVLALGLAYLTRSSKSKAFIAITPAWLIPLFFRMIGSLFSGGRS